MMKGFSSVGEAPENLTLDNPDADQQFIYCVEQAKLAGWLDAWFFITNQNMQQKVGPVCDIITELIFLGSFSLPFHLLLLLLSQASIKITVSLPS